ncbi:hypothetical protein BBD42_26940 [Paenibacillus sp. BIHB 4019]|uniref:Uncharacterized protein n=1 Tax=Paenibacillus sp. BIHB 4019 TaxID=1870819 RepID=A0A1B2DPU2_9BACL|nr:hypothetical protein [Paenibacillus sp. BIHB 4019]ANY69720.1 hypothetical protein BBD42_26940 [Paenibacillus sp. BIHB 4019]
MKFVKKYIKNVYLWLLISPVIINYGLLSWHMPGVVGGEKAWLSFFGSFLGLVGAVLIAMHQMKVQKNNEIKRDQVNNRSYIVMNDFNAPLKLTGIITHENSRLIDTEGYQYLLKLVPKSKQKTVNVSYLKMSHHGNPEVIFDCEIRVELRDHHKKNHLIDINIGAVEKGIEVFIPLVPEGVLEEEEIYLDKVTIKYSTLKNERLMYTQDLIKLRESFISVTDATVIFDHDLIGAKWIFPNKISHEEKNNNGNLDAIAEILKSIKEPPK